MLIFQGNYVSSDLLLLLNCLVWEAVLGEQPPAPRFFITLMRAIALFRNARAVGTKSTMCTEILRGNPCYFGRVSLK